MNTKRNELITYYGITGEHPDITVQDWVEAVNDHETREGYWDFVVREMKNIHTDILEGQLGLFESA